MQDKQKTLYSLCILPLVFTSKRVYNLTIVKKDLTKLKGNKYYDKK